MVVYLKRLTHFVSATRENGACQSDGSIRFDLSHATDVSGWGGRCSGCLSSLTIFVAWWVKRRTWLEGRQCWRRERWRAGNKSAPSERSVQLRLRRGSFYSHSDVFTKGDCTCSSQTLRHCLSRAVWWKNSGGKKNNCCILKYRFSSVSSWSDHHISVRYQPPQKMNIRLYRTSSWI